MPREAQKSTEAHLTVKKLFITGLRDDIDESILQQYFSRFGNITEILVMKDHDGKTKFISIKKRTIFFQVNLVVSLLFLLMTMMPSIKLFLKNHIQSMDEI